MYVVFQEKIDEELAIIDELIEKAEMTEKLSVYGITLGEIIGRLQILVNFQMISSQKLNETLESIQGITLLRETGCIITK